MLTLRLLGELALVNDDEKLIGRASQKRRLALLAVLAVRPGTPVTRDKLLALLWPETPSDEARHRLSAALYDLRRALGDQALVTRGDEVLLAPGVIRCDLVEFETAVGAGDWRAAAEAYRGEFLDGIHLDDAPAFDEWVAQRRTQLSRAHGKALEEWARGCSERGEHTTAVEAWQRLTDTDAFNDRFALGLMKALDAAGNRAGALRYAQAHEDRLRAELGVEPSPDVRAFAASLLAHSHVARPPTDAGQTSAVLGHDPSATTGDAPAASHAFRFTRHDTAIATQAPNAKQHRSPITSNRWLQGVMVLMLLLAAPWLLKNRNGAMNAEPAAVSAVEGEKHLLAGRFEAAVTAFERALTLDSSDARAHMLFALSTLWADQPGDRIDARLTRALTMRDRLGELDRALLDGLVAWRRGEWHTAEGIYRRALAVHPTSAAARHELGEVLFHYNAPQGRSIDEAQIEFERVLESDPNHYGALWHLALLAARDRRPEDVMRLTGRLLALQPDSVRTLEVQSLRSGSAHDGAAIGRLVERLRDVDESLLFSIGWRMAVFSHDLVAADRIFSLLTGPTRGPYAKALGHMHLFYLDAARGRSEIAVQRLDTLAGLRNTGMPVDWLAIVAAVAPDVGVPAARLRSLRDSLAPLAADRTTLAAMSPLQRSALLATLGALHAIVGDSARAMDIAALLEGAGAGDPAIGTSRAATIRALQAWRADRPNDVIRWTAQSQMFRWFGNAVADPINAWSVDRYLRAEALFRLSRFEEADRWFGTLGDHDPSDLAFFPAALSRRSEIARRLGDQVRAQRLELHRDGLRAVSPF